MPSNEDEIADSWATIKSGVSRGLGAVIDLSQPSKLYITNDQAKSFEIATILNEEYESHINYPIEALLAEYKSHIFEHASREVNFIDLGPGYPVKSLVLVDFIRSSGRVIFYFPVDVSEYFLNKSARALEEKGIPTIKIKCKFESLSGVIDTYCKPSINRVFFLGLTFCNFEVDHICLMLSKFVRRDDICLICTQSTEVDTEVILLPYKADDVKRFSFGHLRNLGFQDGDFSYIPQLSGNCVQMVFIANKDIVVPGRVPRGTRIVTAKSFRNSLAVLEVAINKRLRLVHTYSDEKKGLSLIQISGRADSDLP